MADATLGTNGYCLVARVQRQNQTEYDIDSTPTDTDVVGWIAEGFDRINSALDAGGYSVPVDSSYSTGWRIVQDLNAKWAAAEALSAKKTPGASGSRATVPEKAAALKKEVDDFLGLLTSGKRTLVDVPADTEQVQTMGQTDFQGQFRPDSTGAEEDPAIEMDTKW